jgi:mycothiol synthase
MDIAPLPRANLPEAERVLAAACAFDQAAAVADEKLFGPGPTSSAEAFGAWDNGALVGVASVAARWVRLLAVVPNARGRGVGSALLEACESAARARGHSKLGVLDQPGNYLAPGVDERNVETCVWLERRGFARGAELRTNVLVDVRGNPRVTTARLADAIAAARERGYEIRRATRDDSEHLRAAITTEFGGAWPFEVERALEQEPAGVHVALRDGQVCSFAAHDGNNRGLGWFGPTGTWPAHRGQGLGEALLLACLIDVAATHAKCEIAWLGPRRFYETVCGIAGERRFVTFSKSLA